MHSAAFTQGELHLLLFVGSERFLAVDIYQVTSAGCAGVFVLNFVHRITLVLVGSPLATPYNDGTSPLTLSTISEKSDHAFEASSHVYICHTDVD